MPHPTRIADDVFESARAEAEREGRSTAEQINHWARVGRAVSVHDSASRRRVEAALSGALSLADLSPEEGRVYDAEVAEVIRGRLRSIDFGAELAARGVVTVALDEAGRMVEYHPDGSERVLSEHPR